MRTASAGSTCPKACATADSPRRSVERAQAAIDPGPTATPATTVFAELRRALAMRLEREYNRIEADPDGEISVSAGSTGAFYCACMALLDPGDEVILFEPYYGYHVNTLLGGRCGADRTCR